MSVAAASALRKAIHISLAADAPLAALLGGARIFDEAPRATEPPYVTFGEARTRDWSTCTDRGAEHVVLIDVWTEYRGAGASLTIAGRIEALLHDAALTLDDHRLVNLRFEQVESRRENQGRFARASLRLRAVTEAL